MLGFSWTSPEAEAPSNALARTLRAQYVSTSGYDGLRVYVSYAHGDESLEERYGAAKLGRLQALKRRWDPANVFGFDNGLVVG